MLRHALGLRECRTLSSVRMQKTLIRFPPAVIAVCSRTLSGRTRRSSSFPLRPVFPPFFLVSRNPLS